MPWKEKKNKNIQNRDPEYAKAIKRPSKEKEPKEKQNFRWNLPGLCPENWWGNFVGPVLEIPVKIQFLIDFVKEKKLGKRLDSILEEVVDEFSI